MYVLRYYVMEGVTIVDGQFVTNMFIFVCFVFDLEILYILIQWQFLL